MAMNDHLARAYGLTVLSLEWEPGATPTAEEMTDLQALVDESGASVLIWEAEPAAEARDMVTDLGLQDTVFPSLAIQPGETPFAEAFSRAIDALANAAAKAGSG